MACDAYRREMGIVIIVSTMNNQRQPARPCAPFRLV